MPITEVPSGAIFATLLGFIAAAIVLATILGITLPVISTDRRALVAVVLLGTAMCVAGGWAMERPFAVAPTAFVGALSGMLSLVILYAVVTRRMVVLDPIAGLFFGTGASQIADRVGVLAVGVLIAIAWAASTLRQIGLVTAG